jgi:hypothetical protein
VICTFKQGRIADREQAAQQLCAFGLNLVSAAISIGTRPTWLTPPIRGDRRPAAGRSISGATGRQPDARGYVR